MPRLSLRFMLVHCVGPSVCLAFHCVSTPCVSLRCFTCLLCPVVDEVHALRARPTQHTAGASRTSEHNRPRWPHTHKHRLTQHAHFMHNSPSTYRADSLFTTNPCNSIQRQRAILENSRLCNGLCDTREMCAKRARTQYRVVPAKCVKQPA